MAAHYPAIKKLWTKKYRCDCRERMPLVEVCSAPAPTIPRPAHSGYLFLNSVNAAKFREVFPAFAASTTSAGAERSTLAAV